jgi:hypothetical protein
VPNADNTSNEEKPLAQVLAEYKQACDEEFTVDNAVEANEDTAKKSKEMLLKRTPTAVATVEYLAEHAESETVRASCAKYIIDNALGKTGIVKVDDPIADLIKQLQNNDPKDE